MGCKCINKVALALVVIGAINWGLWGFFQFDIVAFIADGNYTWPARIVYSIIGLAGLWSAVFFCKCCGKCCKCGCKNCSCKK